MERKIEITCITCKVCGPAFSQKGSRVCHNCKSKHAKGMVRILFQEENRHLKEHYEHVILHSKKVEEAVRKHMGF